MVNITLTPQQRRLTDVFCAVLAEYHRSFPGTGIGAENVVGSREFELYAEKFFPDDLYPRFYGKYFTATFVNIVMKDANDYQPDAIATYMLLKMFEYVGIDPLQFDIKYSDLVKYIGDTESEYFTETLQYCVDNMIFGPKEQFECFFRALYSPEDKTRHYYMRIPLARHRNQPKDCKTGDGLFDQVVRGRFKKGQKP